MVCFIKVTIIQWYRVLNSQKYEQIYTGKTHPQKKKKTLSSKQGTFPRQFYAQKIPKCRIPLKNNYIEPAKSL